MSTRPSPTYVVDLDDPRAPSQEVWDSLSDAERRRVVESLPSEFPVSESAPPEGDAHFGAKVEIRDTLSRHYARLKRRVYLACELPVYYPAEPMFAPDVMAVLDVDLHPREGWVVSAEGKGLDLALEVHVSGRRLKDFERNRAWFARLGVPEYFVFDRRRLRLLGFRLPSPLATSYEPILPQRGRYESRVLGLDLVVEGERLRFYTGEAALPDSTELIERLHTMIEGLTARGAEAEERAEEEVRRREEAERTAEALRAELERLRGDRPS